MEETRAYYAVVLFTPSSPTQLRLSQQPPYISLSLSSFFGAYQDDSIDSVGLFSIFPLGSTLTYLCGPFFSLTAGRPHTVSPHVQHLLTLLHPMWGLFMSSASMSSPSLSLPSMSSFLKTIFSLTAGCPHTVSPHIQHCLTLLHPMWGLFVIRCYELSFFSSLFYGLFYVDHFLSTVGVLKLFHLIFNRV